MVVLNQSKIVPMAGKFLNEKVPNGWQTFLLRS